MVFEFRPTIKQINDSWAVVQYGTWAANESNTAQMFLKGKIGKDVPELLAKGQLRPHIFSVGQISP